MKEFLNIRYRSLAKISGWLFLLEGILMALPLVVSLVLGEEDWKAFAAAASVTALVGGLAVWFNRHESTRIYRREGYLLISSVWVLFSIFGMLPFVLAEHPLAVTDAFFETMSGFTTTGATVIADVEAQSRSILLWRAEIQWIGGLGIVLFLIAFLPALNGSGGISLFNAEITGVTHDKLHPQIKKTALSLWGVYGALSVAMIPLLMAGGMSFFDSVCQSMSTLSTGGFSTRNAGIASWGSSYIATVVTVFMLLGGINFILLYNAVHGRWRSLTGNGTLRLYSGIVLVSVAMISLTLVAGGSTGLESLVIAPLFHVASAITSTGFTYSDFASWGPVSTAITIMLMICGACAGSTTGGVKVDRVSAMIKNLRDQVILTLFPSHVKRIDLDGKVLEEGQMTRIFAFVTIYLLAVSAGALVMSCYGYSIIDSFFSSASCIGNSGLGYGATGSNYGSLPCIVKWVFSFEMLLGRLEIFTLLVLFYAPFWRR